MFRRIRSHLTFANVTSLIALFVALSGGAYALTIPRNSVGSKQLKRNAVTASKIKRGAVTGSKVKDGSLSPRDFGRNSLPAGPQGPQGPKGDQGPPGPVGVTIMYANVASTGALINGSHATGASKAGDPTSVYSVTFDRSVQGCAAIADAGWTAGSPGGSSSFAGIMQVDTDQAASGGPNTVRVTNATGGDSQTRPTNFHLVVIC